MFYRILFLNLMVLLAIGGLRAQSPPNSILYVAVLQTANYVVGAANLPTGLFRFEGDTLWTPLGWRNIRHNGISFDPRDPDRIYLASGNGVLGSEDGGQTWRLLTGWEITEVQDIVVDPSAPDHLYIATAYGIWRTTDRGATWAHVSEGLRHTFTQVVEVDRSRSGRVFAGTEKGLSLSEDGGQTWKAVGPDDVAIRDITQSRNVPSLFLAGTEDKGVLLSKDGGKTWTFATGQIGGETIYSVAIDENQGQNMAAGGYETGVYVSNDGGRRWMQRKKGLPGLNIHALGFDPSDPRGIWAGTVGYGIYFSGDLGRNWTYRGLKGSEISDLVFAGRTTR